MSKGLSRRIYRMRDLIDGRKVIYQSDILELLLEMADELDMIYEKLKRIEKLDMMKKE